MFNDNQKMKRLMDQLNLDYKRSLATVQDLKNALQSANDENARIADELQYTKGELGKTRGVNEQ